MEPEAPRKLTLSTTDKYVGGVAGGLGRYFGVDAMLFRVAFGVSVVFGGIGIVAYLAFAAFLAADDGKPAWIESKGRAASTVIIVHTVPFRRRKEAPALSSPPNPREPSCRPGTNHLKPTGTSTSSEPTAAATRSIIDDDTSVLPIRADDGQSGRAPPNR